MAIWITSSPERPGSDALKGVPPTFIRFARTCAALSDLYWRCFDGRLDPDQAAKRVLTLAVQRAAIEATAGLMRIAPEAAKPGAKIACVKCRLLDIHRVANAGHRHQAAIRHRIRHPLEIFRRNPAVLLAP